MLRHQLGQNLIFSLDLLLQELDAFLLGLVIGPGLGLKCCSSVFAEFLLPTIETRWLQPQLVTQLGYWHLFQQMPPQDGDLRFPGVMLSCLLHAFSPLS